MPLNLKPHAYRRHPETGAYVLTQLDPYIRIKKLGGEEPPIFIQHGQFYYEDSTVVTKDKLPDWAKEELAKLTPRARKEVGLGDLKV